ncbi:MAG: precorrin-3B C(17)-methyltransferase [Lachnospiraceae bacterium]|nr:precorrin-3B C(17)-methyltransferase [Lachnospiraceae bacterium]
MDNKKLYVVGIGPGDRSYLTARASEALEGAEVIAGYTVYTELIKKYYPDKEYIVTPMTKERERCVLALEAADGGRITAMVCSGDAGVYGMAGLILELACDYPKVDVEIVPGVTAALSGAALLGAPIGHDFAVISLSDILTPWEKIEKRLRMAAQGDFCIVLYNPSSRRRSGYLKRACDILLEYMSGATVCGYVRSIGREGEESRVLSLSELAETEADMFTTVFIGSMSTALMNDKMVTKRI